MTSDSSLSRHHPSANVQPAPWGDTNVPLHKLARRLIVRVAPGVRRLVCPKCRWQCTSRSRRRGGLDHILALFFLHPFRCRSCGRRYYRLTLNLPA